MSASYNVKDRFYWCPGKVTELEDSILSANFDADIDKDINVYEKKKKDERYLKKVCLYKISLFLLEFTMLFVLFGSKYLSAKKEANSLYWSFLRNKISLNDFQKELTRLLKSGKLI